MQHPTGKVPRWANTVNNALLNLAEGWSPSQIAGTLKLMSPDEPQRSVSHETINTCIYGMPKGELRKDLIVFLRRAKAAQHCRSHAPDPDL